MATHEVHLLVRVLRSIRGASQEEMGAAASIDRTTISRYETGDMSPSRPHLTRLAAAAGLSLPFVESVLQPAVRLVLTPAASPALASRPRAGGGGPAETEQAIVDTVRSGIAVFLADLMARGAARRRALPTSHDRLSVPLLWAHFQSNGPGAQRRRMIEVTPDLHTWAFSERLCEESERVAAENAEQALELAQLGLRAGERSPGDASWKVRLQAYAWAFIGNALRVQGDLPAADAAFAMTRTLWGEITLGYAGLLAEWRPLDLEASLRRDQRNWAAASSLLDRARQIAPPEAVGRILIKKATVLERAGDLAAALATLDEAEQRLGAVAEPRLRWVMQFNRLVCFCHLGRYQDADAQLQAATEAATALGHDLDLVRLLWLQGRVAAGQGRRQQAMDSFEQARAEFVARRNIYLTAAVSLELAIVYLEEGRFGEVRQLAGSMVCIFESQQVHRETLASLRLFCEASAAETANAEQVRHLLSCLERARQDPQLVFERSLLGWTGEP